MTLLTVNFISTKFLKNKFICLTQKFKFNSSLIQVRLYEKLDLNLFLCNLTFFELNNMIYTIIYLKKG